MISHKRETYDLDRNDRENILVPEGKNGPAELASGGGKPLPAEKNSKIKTAHCKMNLQ